MKKFVIAFLCCLLMCPVAEARWHGGHGRPHHYHHGWHSGYNIAAGIIGTTAGVLLAEELINANRPRVRPQPRVYVVEPEAKCYTVVSRKTGKVKQECVENASSDVIYVD